MYILPVAQLLAIIYFLSHKELPQSKITHYQWACFYHQLTVNSGVDYSFSSRLRKVCGDSNPDDILHRLTPSVDVDLSEFVEKYFSDLLPHTTVVINILGKKYKDLLKTLVPSSVPSNSVGLMMVSRFKLKNKPLVGLFSVDSGSGKPFSGPRGTSRIVDTIALEFSGILNDYYKPNSDAIGTLDDRFLALVCRMQNWFGGYEYILLGEPVGSPKVQNLDYPWGFVGVGVNDSSLSSPTYVVSHLYKSTHDEDGNPSRANIKQALGKMEILLVTTSDDLILKYTGNPVKEPSKNGMVGTPFPGAESIHHTIAHIIASNFDSSFALEPIVGFLQSNNMEMQEHAVGTLLTMCQSDRCRYREPILKEGVIPGLLELTVQGTTKSRTKAHTLLSAVYLSCNLIQHQRTKHIEIDIHFIIDLVAIGQVRVLHVLSRYQFADISPKGYLQYYLKSLDPV
ncbi:U-box domain-containing protein 4 [Tanacetum coccineum]